MFWEYGILDGFKSRSDTLLHGFYLGLYFLLFLLGQYNHLLDDVKRGRILEILFLP